MAELDEFIKLLAGLLSVVDPIGAIPFFISMTAHRSSEERQHIAWVCSVSVGAVLLFALFSGKFMLEFFGIGIPSFQVAGGIVILLMGISMLKASHDRSRNTPEERAESVEKESIAVVSMVIPLLSGPGAMSSVIVNHNLNPSWSHDFLTSCVIVSVASVVLLCLLMAEKLPLCWGRPV